MSQLFQLHIETGNASFDDDNRQAELARILREVADTLERGFSIGSASGRVYDVNGNSAGSWELGA